jgi:Fur family ferric uptake transcriptional regulator
MLTRNTIQKNLIEKEMSFFKSFFDAEELYVRVSKKNSKIGIATVYRFLKKLSKEGKIHTYLCNRKTIYSSNITSHCHFTCENCGNVKHINLKKLDFLNKEVKGSICHFQIDISGICEQCKTK